DFAGQLVNTTSTSQAVTVSNDGNTTLTFHFALGGANPGQFGATTTSGCGSSALNLCMVPPMSSMGIAVTFSPTSVGTKSATLSITSNDPDPGDGTKTVTLGGAGIAPAIAANPTTLAFADV